PPRRPGGGFCLLGRSLSDRSRPAGSCREVPRAAVQIVIPTTDFLFRRNCYGRGLLLIKTLYGLRAKASCGARNRKAGRGYPLRPECRPAVGRQVRLFLRSRAYPLASSLGASRYQLRTITPPSTCAPRLKCTSRPL